MGWKIPAESSQHQDLQNSANYKFGRLWDGNVKERDSGGPVRAKKLFGEPVPT